MLGLLGQSKLLALAPHHGLGQDRRLLGLVLIHLLQVGYVPELHPGIKTNLELNFSRLMNSSLWLNCRDSSTPPDMDKGFHRVTAGELLNKVQIA